MSTQNISSLIREVVLADPNLANPHDIATRVLELTTDDMLRDYFTQTLTPSIRIFLSQRRSSTLKSQPKGGGSATVAAIRDWAAAFFASSVMVTEGEWKRHGDLSVDEVTAVAAIRGQKEVENARWRAFYEKAAAAMQEAGAETFAALGSTVLAQLRTEAGLA